MKPHHKFIHAYDTIKIFNRIVNSVSFCISELKDQLPDGTILNATFENLKTYITQNADYCLSSFANIQRFITINEAYDLSEYSNRTHLIILSDKEKLDTFANNLKIAIASPQINNKSKLAAISVLHPIALASPIAMFPSMHYMIILNDFLDNSSFVIQNVHPGTGQPTTLTDEQKKKKIRGYLNQFVNFSSHPWPFEYQDEIKLMYAVKDWVLTNLDILLLKDVQSYIDSHIEKLPLMRRTWLLG